MSTAVAAETQYRRAEGVLWRDTGYHVLVLPNRPDAEVVVLGGGGAILWRLLTGERDLLALRGDLESGGADPVPGVDVIARCLADLVMHHLVVATCDPRST